MDVEQLQVRIKELEEQVQAQDQLISQFHGQTAGAFPRGQLNPDDEGELALAIKVEGDTIVVQFGKPISWLGLGSADALKFLTAMDKAIDQLSRNKTGHP